MVTPSLGLDVKSNHATTVNNVFAGPHNAPHVLDADIAAGRQQLGRLETGAMKVDQLNELAKMLVERYGDNEHIEDLEDAIGFRREAVNLTPPSHPYMFGALEMLAYTLCIRERATNRWEDLDEAIDLRKKALNFAWSGQEPTSFVAKKKFFVLNHLSQNFRHRFNRTGHKQDLDDAVCSFNEALTLDIQPRERRVPLLMDLMAVLHDRYMVTKEISNLMESIPLFNELMILQPPSDPYEHRSSFLNFLAATFQSEFDQQGGIHYLYQSIALHRQALQNIPYSHPFRSRCLYDLATALHLQTIRHDFLLDHLVEAIQLHREALKLRPYPHPDRADSLDNLAITLRSRFKFGGERELEYLNEAIELHRQSLTLVNHSDEDYTGLLNNLGLALENRYEYGGNQDDLVEAISLRRRSLELAPYPHRNHFALLTNMAKVLHTFFLYNKESRFLEEAIDIYKHALGYMSPENSEHHSSFSDLFAMALLTRLEHTGINGSTHFEEIVNLQRQALELVPYPHPTRPHALNGLAHVLHAQFEHDGGLPVRLSEAIELFKEALRLIPDIHPDRSGYLNNLGRALECRFTNGGGLNYIQEAITIYRQALKSTPHPHPQYPITLTNLANALTRQFEQEGALDDLDHATVMYREVLQLQSRHEDSQSLNNLAVALQMQYTRRGDMSLLLESIELFRRVATLTPVQHPARRRRLCNLAAALYTRFKHDNDVKYLKESIHLLETELNFSPREYSAVILPEKSADNDHVHHSHYPVLSALSRLYAAAHEAVGSGQYLQWALSTFLLALNCPGLSPFQRFKIALQWAQSADNYQHSSAMDAYDYLIRLLPQLSSLGHSINQRQKDMFTHGDIQTIAHRASQYAISVQRFDKAIEYLEAARTLLWLQIFQLRSPFDRLISAAPDLGRRLKEIAAELDRASHVDSPLFSDDFMSRPGDMHTLHLANLAIEWEEKLTEARKIQGFEDYLLPLRLSILQKAADACPIALLIPHQEASSCLVITSTTIHHIHIPNLSTPKLRNMAIGIQEISLGTLRSDDDLNEESCHVDDEGPTVSDLHVEGRLKASRKGVRRFDPNDSLREILEELWREVVKPVISVLQLKKLSGGDRTTLQWCATGLFALLPIHAAGIYSAQSKPSSNQQNTEIESASDYIISSFTPTLSSLLKPSQPNAGNNNTGDFKMLAVVSATDLPMTKQELVNINARAPAGCITVLGFNSAPACVEAVVSHLPSSSIVHFACHGVQDRMNPLHSGLFMSDGKLTIAKIMEQSVLPGSLAFLCACETATGDENQPDEALSIAASMLFSGFRSVIATMWKIMDKHGPTIADAFYEELFRGTNGLQRSHPDFNKTALALDIAVQKLKNTGAPLVEWVPFIHMGKIL